MPNDPTICAARPVACARSAPGPVPDSPKHISSAASPPSAIAMPLSIPGRVRVSPPSSSLCASNPSEPRLLMIDRTSRRRPFPKKYATVAWPASWLPPPPPARLAVEIGVRGGLLQTDLLVELRVHHVAQTHLAAAVAERHEQGLVEEVLDHDRRVTERLRCHSLARVVEVELVLVRLALEEEV